MKRLLLFPCLFFGLLPLLQAADEPLFDVINNGGFEIVVDRGPAYWSTGIKSGKNIRSMGSHTLDDTRSGNGRRSLKIRPDTPEGEFYFVQQVLDISYMDLKGKTIHFSGHMLTRHLNGAAKIWIELVSDKPQVVEIDDRLHMSDRFNYFERKFTVKRNPDYIILALGASAKTGSVWFDDIRCWVEGARYKEKLHSRGESGISINTAGWECGPSVSSDGKEMFFAYAPFNHDKDIVGPDRPGNHGRDNFDIYRCVRQEDGSWSEPDNLPFNSVYRDSSPDVSADGKRLFFVSDRRRPGTGDGDIYVAERLYDGSWSIPIRLPYSVNTGFPEDSPHLTSDGKTLYFASKRLGGEGDWDIWVSRKGADDEWSEPEEIGSPPNSPSIEWQPFLMESTGRLYMGCSMKEDGKVCSMAFSEQQMDGSWTSLRSLKGLVRSFTQGEPSLTADGKTLYFEDFRKGGKGLYDIWVATLEEDGSWSKSRLADE